MNPDMVVEIRDLAIGYKTSPKRAIEIAAGIDVSLVAGEFVCLLGPNGAGKSTLIRTMTGIQPALRGGVLLGGKPVASYDVRQLAQRLSLVLTQRVAVGMMRVVTLVSLGRHPYTDWTGRLTEQDEKAVWQAIADVGIEDLAQRPVCELSDGERQKAMIARALAQEPQVMILDEATAFLDLPRRVELMQLLRRLARASGRAILLSTHDLDLALRNADRLWLLAAGGEFQHGAPEDLVLSDAFAATFADAGVKFDKGTGAFASDHEQRGAISIVGSGVPAMWTYRALERAGYRIVPEDEAFVSVEVGCENGRIAWRIDRCRDKECRSVEELLSTLRTCDPMLSEAIQ